MLFRSPYAERDYTPSLRNAFNHIERPTNWMFETFRPFTDKDWVDVAEAVLQIGDVPSILFQRIHGRTKVSHAEVRSKARELGED